MDPAPLLLLQADKTMAEGGGGEVTPRGVSQPGWTSVTLSLLAVSFHLEEGLRDGLWSPGAESKLPACQLVQGGRKSRRGGPTDSFSMNGTLEVKCAVMVGSQDAGEPVRWPQEPSPAPLL